MNVEELLKRLIPFQAGYSKEQFLSILTPELLEVLKQKIINNTKWRIKAENEPVYFILDDDRWKWPKRNNYNVNIKINLIGYDKKPVISITYLP